MKKSFLLAALAAFGLAASARADTIVFSDDFESYATTTPGTGTASLGAVWSADFGTTVDVLDDGAGNQFIDLVGDDSGGSGYLYGRTLILSAGNYTLSFDLAGAPQGVGTSTTEWQVAPWVVAGGEELYPGSGIAATNHLSITTGANPQRQPGAPFAPFTFDVPNLAGGLYRVLFIAPGFTDASGISYGLRLDNVVLTRLDQTPPVVPLPAAVWLGLVPLGGLAAGRAWQRRRRATLS